MGENGGGEIDPEDEDTGTVDDRLSPVVRRVWKDGKEGKVDVAGVDGEDFPKPKVMELDRWFVIVGRGNVRDKAAVPPFIIVCTRTSSFWFWLSPRDTEPRPIKRDDAPRLSL